MVLRATTSNQFIESTRATIKTGNKKVGEWTVNPQGASSIGSQVERVYGIARVRACVLFDKFTPGEEKVKAKREE